jgi:decaprenylphospho-beta-D-erythro-pentofuranosid-2-ulose 2-reductase
VLGSVAGDRGRLKNYLYGSTKATSHFYVGGLRARLFSAAVTATMVKSSVIDTALTRGMPPLLLAGAEQYAARARLKATHRKQQPSMSRSGRGDAALDPALARRHTLGPEVLN